MEQTIEQLREENQQLKHDLKVAKHVVNQCMNELLGAKLAFEWKQLLRDVLSGKEEPAINPRNRGMGRSPGLIRRSQLLSKSQRPRH
jgi:hypothetical protein